MSSRRTWMSPATTIPLSSTRSRMSPRLLRLAHAKPTHVAVAALQSDVVTLGHQLPSTSERR